METTRNTSIIWWILGAIVVLGLIWFFAMRNGNNPGIPNTGTDTTFTTPSDSSDTSNSIIDDSYLNSSSSNMVDQAKG